MRAEKNDLSKPTHLPSKSDLVTALSLTLSSLIGVACVLGERSTCCIITPFMSSNTHKHVLKTKSNDVLWSYSWNHIITMLLFFNKRTKSLFIWDRFRVTLHLVTTVLWGRLGTIWTGRAYIFSQEKKRVCQASRLNLPRLLNISSKLSLSSNTCNKRNTTILRKRQSQQKF